MKKTLLALAVLGSAATAASAATSVTLYGVVDAGYEGWSGDGSRVTQGGARSESRLGVKGNEDLGNGLSATFQLEGEFAANTGSYGGKSAFGRESTIGLKGNFGHIRLGRSTSALENALSQYNVGHRVADVNAYRSSDRHSNGLFYDFSNNGFSAGFDVTTKGSEQYDTNGDSIEGQKGTKASYGVYAGYKANNFAISAAYQADRSNKFKFNSKDDVYLLSGVDKEWGVGASYTFKPVTFGLTYAAARNSYKQEVSKNLPNLKSKTWGAYVSADLTAQDNVYLKYQQSRNKTTGVLVGALESTDFTGNSNNQGFIYSDVLNYKQTMYALGYSHALSKRTSIYADVARYDVKYSNLNKLHEKRTGYNVAVRHAF